MKKFIVLFFSFVYFPVFAQTKVYEIPIDKNGEKSYTYTSFRKILNNIPLDSLENSVNDFHFRYITPRHILELWKNENEKVDGELISFVEKQPDSMDLNYLNDKTPKNYFILSQKLKHKSLKAIFEKLIKVKLDTIPSKLMEDWKSNNINGTLMEFASEDGYKFKEFWMSNFKEKHDLNDKMIADFLKLMRDKINYDKAYKKLIKVLPKGCFDMANGTITCK